MRTAGIVVIVLGGILVWLAWQGKVLPFFQALVTGTAPKPAASPASTGGSTQGATVSSAVDGGPPEGYVQSVPDGTIIPPWVITPPAMAITAQGNPIG